MYGNMTIIDDGSVLKKVNIRWMQNKEVISYLLGGKDIRIPRLYDSLRGIELNTISMLQSIGNNQIRESVRLKVLYGNNR
jgi:hypothetical protein